MNKEWLHLAAQLTFPVGSLAKSFIGSNTIYVVSEVNQDFVNFRIQTVGGGVSLTHVEALTRMILIKTEDNAFTQFNIRALPGGLTFEYGDNIIDVDLGLFNLNDLLQRALKELSK